MTDTTPRFQLAAVTVLVVVGLMRGLFWSVALEVTSPIDEVQHLAYVVSVAEDGTPPVVGDETVPREFLEIVARSRTWPVRQVPVEFSTEDPAWGAVVASYEGVQPPLYYATLAPVYLAADAIGAGPLAILFLLRAASVVLALTAVPLLYLLARELFPRRPLVWLSAPALLVVVQGFNGNLAQVSNDVLVVPVSLLALLPVARAIRRGPTWWQAVALGGLLGLAQLTKATTVGLIVMAAIGALIAVAIHRPGLRRLVGWPLLVGSTAAIVVAPWIAWNLATYDAISAASQIEGITGPLQPEIPMSLRGLITQAKGAASAFWELQLTFLEPWHPYPLTWYVATAVAAAGTALHLVRSRGWVRPSIVAWLVVSLPVSFASMLLVIYLATGGAGAGLGRHLYVALAPTVLAVAAGIVVSVPRRAAMITLTAIVTVALWFEVGPTRGYLEVYTRGVEGAAVPVVDQTANDAWVTGQTVLVTPPCPATAVRLIVDDETPPRTLTGGPSGQLRLASTDSHPVGWTSARYEADGPLTAPFAITVPDGLRLGSVADDRTDALAFEGREGDPTASILCEVEDPLTTRFEQVYDQMHPDAIDRGLLTAWPLLWAWTGTAIAAIAIARAVQDRARSRGSADVEDVA